MCALFMIILDSVVPCLCLRAYSICAFIEVCYNTYSENDKIVKQ